MPEPRKSPEEFPQKRAHEGYVWRTRLGHSLQKVLLDQVRKVASRSEGWRVFRDVGLVVARIASGPFPYGAPSYC